jgi:hypothetical protein
MSWIATLISTFLWWFVACLVVSALAQGLWGIILWIDRKMQEAPIKIGDYQTRRYWIEAFAQAGVMGMIIFIAILLACELLFW